MENTDKPLESKEKVNQNEQNEEEIKPENKLLNELNKDKDFEEIELKDDYSIDDISYSQLEKKLDEEEDEYSLPLSKKRKLWELSQLILSDNLEEFKKIIEENQSLIKKRTLDGFTLIQYAALNGALNCFIYLLSLKVPTNEDIEGFFLIHLSLMKAIKIKNSPKCVQMFNFIYNNLPEQRKYKDRLGRTYLHLILEYNFSDALNNNIAIEFADLYEEDNMGQFAINYIYIYDSYESFCALAQAPQVLFNIYLTTRNKFKESKISNLSGEEKFLENIIIYKNYRILRFIIKYSGLYPNELNQDLNIIHTKYFSLMNEKPEKENDDMNISINNMLFFIQNFVHGILEEVNYNKTAIVYNKDCINHIKLPEKDPIKHFKQKEKLIENSDRLYSLIDEENGIMLNNSFYAISESYDNGIEQIKNYVKIFALSTERKSCLNDILKCHDIKYIKALKYKSDNIKFSKLKKKEKNLSPPPKFWEDINMELIEKNYFLFNDNNSQTTSSDNNEQKENMDHLTFYQKMDVDTYINKYSYQNIYNTTGCVFEAIDLVMKKAATNAFALIRPPGHHAGYYGPVENTFEPSNGFCIVNNVAIGAAYAKYKYNEIIKKIAIVDIDVHHGNGTEEIIEMLNFKNFSKPFNYEKICGVKIEDKRSINWYDFDDSKNVLFISTHLYDKNKPDNFYPYSGSEEKNTPKDSDIYPGGIYNIPLELKKNYPYEYRNILRTKIIPRLYKFKPDIIFVSAGFDGHRMEAINQQKMLLQEHDFAYIAEQIQFVANKFCNGRLVAVLEGGYNANTGIISPFAQSVYAFTRHLNIAINMYQFNDIKLTNHKRENLYNEEMELYKSNVKEEEIDEEDKPRRSERLRHLKEIEKREKEMKEINGINDIKENENEIKEEKGINTGNEKEKEIEEINGDKNNENNKAKEETEEKKEEKNVNLNMEDNGNNINKDNSIDKDKKIEENNVKEIENENNTNIENNNINNKEEEKEKDIKNEENKDKEKKEVETIKNEQKEINDENKEKQTSNELKQEDKKIDTKDTNK